MKKLTLNSHQESLRRPMKPAVFFDLDGTVITTKSGETFPKDEKDWKLISGVRALMLDLMADDTQIIILTNQGGIEQGFSTHEKFKEKMEAVVKELDLPNEIQCYYSPTIDKQDIYRKPHAGLFYIAAMEHSIFLPNSVFIGDASGHTEIPRERILSKKVIEKTTYVTTSARKQPQAVIKEDEKSYTINCWSDSDVQAAVFAGISNYRDIDQILHQFDKKTKK